MRPNILFVLTDNQRHDLLGSAPNPIIHTPTLDRLASRGTRFTHAFATTPICAASRASILTGLYERRHQFTFDAPPLRSDLARTSYPALLRQAGYRTGLIGKLGIESRGIGDIVDIAGAPEIIPELFDHLDNYEHWTPAGYEIPQDDGSVRHLTDLTGDKAIAFIRDSRQPFCLSISFNAPHAQDDDPRQYIWPESEDLLYADTVFPPIADPTEFDALPPFIQNSESRRRWGLRYDTPEKYQRSMRGLYRMVSGVDRNLGRILSELERLGIADQTVVVFSSDHGMFYGERGLSDCWLLHEESLRVPLLVYDPREQRSRATCDRMVLNIDIAPTLLALAGLPAPEGCQGRSLVPLLGAEPVHWRRDFLCEHHFAHPGIPKSEGLRTEKWKYFRYYEEEPPYEALYDLETDPGERTNLAADPAAAQQLQSLRARCDQLISAAAPSHS